MKKKLADSNGFSATLASYKYCVCACVHACVTVCLSVSVSLRLFLYSQRGVYDRSVNYVRIIGDFSKNKREEQLKQ